MWVLGGGGVTGIAWEIGVLFGLADEGVTVAADAVLLGTSAGAVVGAQLAGGTSLVELFERQHEMRADAEVSSGLGPTAVLRLVGAAVRGGGQHAVARRIGALALAARADPTEKLLRIIRARLVSHEWTERDLRIVAVDVASGEPRIFTRSDDVALVSAIAASCAVPLAVAPIAIGDRRYMDGGMRSTVNLDLAPGAGAVVALAPSTASLSRSGGLARQQSALGPGRAVEIITQDAASRRAAGRDVMNRSVVPTLVAVARAQGRREAERIGAVLTR